MYSIGEFSKITGISVKALRFYHEQGVLEPTSVDGDSSYRYYAENKVETARVIAQLRSLNFSLAEIAEILQSFDDEADILDQLERKRETIEEDLQRFREISRILQQIIVKEREARKAMQNTPYEIEEKTVEPMLIAGFRMKGRYKDCGKGFGKVCWQFGRYMAGKPMMLIYDSEFKENDADFEPCVPIRKGEKTSEIDVRELPGGMCLTLLHKGPYEELSRSYERLVKHIKEKGYETLLPSREVYLKGPGMIFRGNPKNYLTEIQIFVKK